MRRMRAEKSQIIQLGRLPLGQSARIILVEGAGGIPSRLMEMGLLEGTSVEIAHEAPFGGDPIAVRVRGALIALRRREANYIWVAHG